MSRHSMFILSPCTKEMTDFNSALASIGPAMESSIMFDYLHRALFIKMTGSQEQKLKCVCWELASNDYQYRYKLLKNSMSECSSYDEKKQVIKDLVSEIRKREFGFDSSKYLDSFKIDKSSYDFLKSWYEESPLKGAMSYSFFEFENYIVPNMYGIGCIISKDAILNGCSTCSQKNCSLHEMKIKWTDIYELFYMQRNRFAHNLESYQANLPSINMITSPNGRFENIFVKFYILLVIDDVIRRLFEKYQTLI